MQILTMHKKTLIVTQERGQLMPFLSKLASSIPLCLKRLYSVHKIIERPTLCNMSHDFFCIFSWPLDDWNPVGQCHVTQLCTAPHSKSESPIFIYGTQIYMSTSTHLIVNELTLLSESKLGDCIWTWIKDCRKLEACLW